MNITYVDNLYKYLNSAIPIGVGTTAICFLMSNKKVLKLFYNSFSEDKIVKFNLINEIGNDTFIAPQELLIKNNKVIGYIYDYIDAKIIHNISPYKKISDILKNYDKLVLDTKKISEKNFKLFDIHDKNILFDSYFYVIDLDEGNINNEKTKEQIFKYNIGCINKCIIYAIFKIKTDEIISFYDLNIESLYDKSILGNYEKFPILLETLGADFTIKNIKKKTLYKKSINSYYKYF